MDLRAASGRPVERVSLQFSFGFLTPSSVWLPLPLFLCRAFRKKRIRATREKTVATNERDQTFAGTP